MTNPNRYIKNFRDVGESVNLLMGEEFLLEKKLYRGGRLNFVFSHEEILNIPTILNLRSGKDEEKFSCSYLHVPAKDKLENYDTKNKNVKKWINSVMEKILDEELLFPLFLHCTSGKDRTGVIVAVILKALGVNEKIIVQEYLLSSGVQGAKDIAVALKGVGEIENYLKHGYVELLRDRLLDNK